MSNRAKSISAVTLGAIVLLVGACSSPSSQQSSGASPIAGSDASLNIACSQQEDFCQEISSAFQRETGIKTTYVRLGAGEVLARLETNPGEFDVWAGGQAENHLIADDRDFVEIYVSPEADALPEQYNDSSGVWSGFYTDSVAFCSNKKELETLGADAPTSWDDLLNPALKGAVAMPHPATAGVGYMAMNTVKILKGGDEDATIDYFVALHPNVMQYSKSAATGTEQAGRGEVAVAIALDSDCEKAIQAGYGDLLTTYPAEGTGYEVGSVSILKDARNPEAAHTFFDWILSPEAQNLYADIPSFAAPTNPDAEVGENVPVQDTVFQVDWNIREAADGRDAIIERFETDVASSSTAQ